MRAVLKVPVLLAAIAILCLACTGNSVSTTATQPPPTTTRPPPTTAEGPSITYWVPADPKRAHQACAATFKREHPGVSVTVVEQDSDSYVADLFAALKSEDPPDTFVVDVETYPRLHLENLVLDLLPYITRDSVDLEAYYQVVVDAWRVNEDSFFALPKDWDGPAVYFNRALLPDSVSAENIAESLWTPSGDGSFELLVAESSAGGNGNRGNESAFDPTDVDIYGLAIGYDSPIDVANFWAAMALSNGFNPPMFTDDGNNEFQFTDTRFGEPAAWAASLADAGWLTVPRPGEAIDQFANGDVAIVIDSLAKLDRYASTAVDLGIAPMPAGPTGPLGVSSARADAIAAVSPHPETAWQWITFLRSECHLSVGQVATGLPALVGTAKQISDGYREEGIELDLLLENLNDAGLAHQSITFGVEEISEALGEAFLEITEGRIDVDEALEAVSEQADSLLDQTQNE